MKAAAIGLIVISVGVLLYFSSLSEPPTSEPQPAAIVADDVTQRSTSHGAVVGFIGKGGSRTWLGIPFAKPPTGNLRWRPPLPPEPWRGVRETIAHSNICPQFSNATTPGQEGVIGSEDCLYLNIYAPANARGLPVMFWIHGGGNSFGHAGTYDGSTLASSQNVIVVTTNYRLAHLGWFSHPALLTGEPRHDSGNYGLLDLIRALEWTRDNIAEFGGDPNNVTIFGESAGATDALALVVSPVAANLFHRAIAQSGGLGLYPMQLVRDYASDGGLANSAREIVNQFLIRDGLAADQVQARQVQNNMDPTALAEYLYDRTITDLFSPFEADGIGTIPTLELFADGYVLPSGNVLEVLGNIELYNDVPLILGTNRDEVSVFMYADPRHVTTTDNGRRFVNEAAYLREVKYGSLAVKESSVDRLAIALTNGGNKNVYAYRFDWDEAGIIDGFDYSKALGAPHAAEIPFVFGDFTTGWVLEDIYSQSVEKDILADNMMSYWTQFALTGNPDKGRNGDLPQWRAWDTEGKTTLVLDTPSDQGIYMLDGALTPDTLKAQLAEDASIESKEERCARYAQMFLDGPHFDPEEYARGCSGLDPRALRGF